MRDRMVIYGGLVTGMHYILNDIWALSFSGTPAWSHLPWGDELPPRLYHSAIYDPVRDRMVVFGGQAGAGVFLNDTWAFQFTAPLGWSQLTPTGSLPDTRID